MFTFDQTMTDDYAALLNLPVRTMPTVHAGLRAPRLRKKDRSGKVNVAFLGHQRPEKGYDLIPDIVRRLFDRRLPVKLLVHNSARGDSETSRELRRMAAANTDISFVEEPGDQLRWQQFLDKADLIILPYEPNRYRQSGSGIAAEAVSEGIPMVVPRGTTMETLAVTYQGCTMTFARWGATEIADAIERALGEFEPLAREAETGALVWRRNNGVELFVDRLLETADCKNHHLHAARQNRSSFDVVARRVLDGLVSHLTR